MKLFAEETNEELPEPERTAQLCVESGIRIMRLIRRAIREAPPTTLTLPGLRALAFLDENPEACLSDLADHLIVGPPTASKLVDDLVERALLKRSARLSDRRRLALAITPAGRRMLKTAARPARDRMGRLLARLPARDLARVRKGLEALLPALIATGAESGHGTGKGAA